MIEEFEDFLLGERILQPSTARKRINLLAFMQTEHDFNLARFMSGRDAGKKEGVRLVATLRRKEKPPSTISNYTRTLACLAEFAGYEGLRFRGPRVPDAPPRALKPAEFAALRQFRYPGCDRVSRQLRALMMAAYFTAMRPGELIRMERRDLDAENLRFFVRYPQKGGSQRWLPVEKEFFATTRPFMAWVRYLDKLDTPPENQCLWWTKGRGRPWNNPDEPYLRRLMNKYVQPATGVNATFYSFRHTRAVAMHKAKLDVVWIKGYLGHRKLETTWNYLRSLGVGLNDAFRDIKLPGYTAAE